MKQEKLEDYTEAECKKIWDIDVSSEEEHERLVEHFVQVTEHPYGNGLIFYPEAGVEDSPQGVMTVIKNWRATQGKPGFKPA